MSQLAVFNAGAVYDLDDGVEFIWSGYDNLGMAPQHRITERSPQQNGVTDLGYRLDPRVLSLSLIARANSLADAAARRRTLLNAFSPATSGSANTALTLQIGIGTASESVPSSSGVVIPKNVENEFTHTSYPVITIENTTGVAISPTWIISNTTQGTSFTFSGSAATVAAGDYVRFDLRYGYKTVTNSSGSDLSALVTGDIDTYALLTGSNSCTFVYSGTTLSAEYEYSDTYGIDGYYSGGLQFASSEMGSYDQKIAAQFFCPDPTFYAQQVETETAGTGSTHNIIIEGDVQTFPVITIVNSGVVPSTPDFNITNMDTDDSIYFDGTSGSATYSLAAGDTITIDLRWGHKTVTDGSGTNLMPWIDPTGDLATFALVPGDNRIAYLSLGAGMNSAVLTYYERFVGL